jgi:hypothetical protein
LPLPDITGAYIFLYVIVIILIRAQYEKYMEFQDEVIGQPSGDISHIIRETVLIGLVAGVVCSFSATAAGISLNADTVRYLFFIMCFLLLLNLRLVCISNAAGILALISLIFGYPRIDVPSVLALAAILHIIEALLIFLNAGRGSIPVFISHNGDIAGAFLIRKFWLVPVIFFLYLFQGGSNGFSGGLWGGLSGAYALGLDCMVAFLGYSDLAITMPPERKCRQSAIQILGYSLILFVIALLSVKIHLLMYFGAVFCIAAHEGIYLYGKHREKAGTPLFSAVHRGLRVMDVLPGSHALRMGINRGDIILSINGKDIQSDESVGEALKEYPTYTWIEATESGGKSKTYEYRCFPDGYNALGIITVPREKDVTYGTNNFEHLSILKNIVSRFRGVSRSI